MKTKGTRELVLRDADYTPDIQLRIRPQNSMFEADCQIGAYPFRFPIKLTVADMNDMCHGLQSKLDQLRIAFDDNAPNPEECQEALRLLAEEGRGSFLKIVNPKGARNKLDSVLSKQRGLVVQITSEEFSLPWDALYCRDLLKKVSFDYFWGMRHIVSRIIILDSGNEAPPDHLISTRVPHLGLLTNKDLDNLLDRELPFFKAKNGERAITLHHLDKDLDPSRPLDFQHVKHFLKKRYHILHFACHADYVAGEGPKVVITRDFDVSLKKLISYECNVQGNPVVFLNACRTSDLEPTYFSSLARHFLSSGARGVIATECEIPDEFAADFSENIYSQFLHGTSLGECMLRAKRHFYTHPSNNPLGLLYSLYGPPSVRLIRKGETNGSN